MTQIDSSDYVLSFGPRDTSRLSRTENISLALDQSFMEYLVEYFNAVKWGKAVPSVPSVPSEEPTGYIIRSIRISAIKARVNYRPRMAIESDTPSTPSTPSTNEPHGAAATEALRWIPIKEAVIKMAPFDGFGLTGDELLVAIGMHIMKDKKNLARIVGGVKPIRASVEIFRNVTELILVPTQPISPSYSNDIKGMLSQMQHVSARTIVSILELVPSSPSLQPSGVKQGIIQAGQVFQRDMKTIVAFVSGENANIDLLDVPLMIIQPLTSPITALISGVCNQLDPVRLERLRNKYR